MQLDDIHTIDEMRVLAKRRLPRVVFDYIDGGAGGPVAVHAQHAVWGARIEGYACH